MKKIYLFALLSLVLFIPTHVKAECDNTDSIKIHKIARNITTSYLYDETSKTFTITLNNVPNEYKIYSYDFGRYVSSNVRDGEINITTKASGEYRFDISLKNDFCKYGLLEYKYVNIPYLNPFYETEICNGIEDYKYCQKWFDKYQYDSTIKKQIEDYKNSLKKEEVKQDKKVKSIFEYIGEYIIKYYQIICFIILPLILIIIIILIIRKRRKEDLF